MGRRLEEGKGGDAEEFSGAVSDPCRDVTFRNGLGEMGKVNLEECQIRDCGGIRWISCRKCLAPNVDGRLQDF